jgi:AcrR family transcriptional regulator
MVPMSQDHAPSQRQRNKEDTRRRILAAARGCFGTGGFDAVTMDEIAAAAEVSRATLFNYFPSKVSILTAFSRQFDEQMKALADQQRARPVPTSQRIRGMLAEAARSLEAAPASVRRLVAIMERSWAEADSAIRMQDTIGLFRGLLEDGLKRGDVRPDLDCAVAAEIVAHSFVGIVHMWCFTDGYPLLKRSEIAGKQLAAMLEPR